MMVTPMMVTTMMVTTMTTPLHHRSRVCLGFQWKRKFLDCNRPLKTHCLTPLEVVQAREFFEELINLHFCRHLDRLLPTVSCSFGYFGLHFGLCFCVGCLFSCFLSSVLGLLSLFFSVFLGLLSLSLALAAALTLASWA